ncbi:MAG: hypothetical protein HYZ45_01930, partial [Burkholderiales bacterium]|nr:hypothetical protein [Burkholderiales bacterium]
MHFSTKLAFAFSAACGSLLCQPVLAADNEPKIQSYTLDFEAKFLTDRRNRGTSDTFNKPGVEFTMTAAHESGFIGLLQLGSVRKEIFPDSNEVQVLGALGYRWGKPDAWHFGVGIANEWFPGGKLNGIPGSIDWNAGAPTSLVDTKFDTTYGVFEFGYGIVEARYLYVLSEDLRGNNSATICGSLYLPAVLAGGDPTKAMQCYDGGLKHTGGSQLLDIDVKYKLDGQTKLIGHVGYQKMKNFSGGNIFDYKVVIVHTRWGFDFGLDLIGASLGNSEYGVAFDSNGNSKRIDKTVLVGSIGKRF